MLRALPLAAGELVREAVERIGRQLDQLEQLGDARLARRACRGRGAPCPRRRSSAPSSRGSSDSYGSWKMICALRRNAAHLGRRGVQHVVPVEADPAAASASISRSTRRASVDLAAAALADQRQRLAGADLEVDTCPRPRAQLVGAPEEVAGDGVPLRQPLHAQERLSGANGAWGCSSGAHGSRRSVSSGGCCSTQVAMRFGQRAAKRQAGGMAAELGHAARDHVQALAGRGELGHARAAGPGCRGGADRRRSARRARSRRSRRRTSPRPGRRSR